MPKTLERTSHLNCSPDEAWGWMQTTRLLNHISGPLIRFIPQRATPFPMKWLPGEYRAWMLALGVIPLGWQAIVISLPAPQGDTRFVRDNGYGPLIKSMDHWIEIAPDTGGGTRYTDRVTIEAGALTPIVFAFADVFFAHRQRRWRKLAESGFTALR